MNIQELIQHPERLNRETLYELRRITALYPYYQPARLLLIRNLFLLHDTSFNEELRKAAIYFTDRQVLFDLIEGPHYELELASIAHGTTQASAPANDVQTMPTVNDTQTTPSSTVRVEPDAIVQKEILSESAESVDEPTDTTSRTDSIIDNFLSNLDPVIEAGAHTKHADKQTEDTLAGHTHRKPTAADATIDYVAYLMQTDFEDTDVTQEQKTPTKGTTDSLIDAFIDGGRITLQDKVEFTPEMPLADNSDHQPDDGIITETLAGIYIKQHRYQKALDIICRLNENAQKKNPYFEDQKRFLQKLIAMTGK